ncbi:hypothetical protein ACFW04_009618 [Cataglyphis niger]
MFVTAILLLVLILLLLYLGCHKPKGYPPGPRWWPILGCALEVARIRQETGYLFKTCSTLCKKYGPVVGLKIGKDRIVILNDLESVRAMLTNEDCDGRPIGPLFEARTFGARRGLIVVDERLWMEQRRFVLRHLREFGFGRTSMATIIEDEALKLVEHFKKLLRDGHNYEITDIRKLTIDNNNTGQIYKLKDSKNNLNKSKLEVDIIGAPFSHFPLLRFIAPELSGYKSFLQTHEEVWAFLKEELHNHKNTFVSNAPRDLIDVYLTVLNSKDCSDTFSESQLLAICVDLFVAGSETTSKALGFGFLYLILFPQVQRKAHEEIDKVLGRDRFPTLADRPRMFMGRTLNVPHRALKDTSIVGHKIPKDTMLIVNFNSMLMDESWSDPENFRPERFLDSSGNVVTPENYFPFSIGRHRCMGEILARSNIFIITATLLQAFSFSVIPGEPRPSTQDFVDGVTSTPKPYRALVSLRT